MSLKFDKLQHVVQSLIRKLCSPSVFDKPWQPVESTALSNSSSRLCMLYFTDWETGKPNLFLLHGFCCAVQRSSSAVEAKAVVSFQRLCTEREGGTLSSVLPSDIGLTSAHRPLHWNSSVSEVVCKELAALRLEERKSFHWKCPQSSQQGQPSLQLFTQIHILP